MFLCLSGILYFFMQNQSIKKDDWQYADAALSEDASFETNTNLDKEMKVLETIKVYICGAVKTPGVYEVSSDNRLDDVVKLCGGFCKNADVNTVNLARYLEDGEKIYILTKEEANEAKMETTDDSDGLVNINTATMDELMTLPGIGHAKAEKIIAYRGQATRFESIQDIMKIEGIKQGVYEKIKDFIKI